MTRDRSSALADVVAIVRELTDTHEVTDWVDWRPTREGMASPARAARDRVTGPTMPTRRPERRIWRSDGLLAELEAAVGTRPTVALEATTITIPAGGDLRRRIDGTLIATATDQAPARYTVVRARPGEQARLLEAGDVPGLATDTATTHRAPTSAPPPGARHVEALADVRTAIAETYRRIVHDATRDDAAAQLRAIVGAATTLDDDGLRAVTSALRSIRRTARLALGHESPVLEIPNVQCPECLGIGTLRVRAGATSDVWCSARLVGPPTWDGAPPRCATRWPRTSWIRLLDPARPA